MHCMPYGALLKAIDAYIDASMESIRAARDHWHEIVQHAVTRDASRNTKLSDFTIDAGPVLCTDGGY